MLTPAKKKTHSQTRKLNIRLFGLLVLLVICITLNLNVHADDSDSMVNERILVKPEQLESHWKINCARTLNETQTYLQNKNSQPQAEQKLLEDLKKCSYIYNRVDSVHFKSTPDYRLLAEKLGEMRE